MISILWLERGNHEIMVRGTFANLRIKNLMIDKQGGYTKHYPTGQEDEIYNVAEKYSTEVFHCW